MTNYGGTETDAGTKQHRIMRASSPFRRKWAEQLRRDANCDDFDDAEQ